MAPYPTGDAIVCVALGGKNAVNGTGISAIDRLRNHMMDLATSAAKNACMRFMIGIALNFSHSNSSSLPPVVVVEVEVVVVLLQYFVVPTRS